MPDELNKDIVGARINLDTSKILPAFKVIDDGVKQNADSFKALNAELALTEKSYTSMAAAMDKIALSADERRQKILAESDALVKQRTAQAALLTAKKNQLDTTNQVIDAKLQAQQAIVKQREDAIEQQEKEHQQRMATLQQKTAAASGQDSLIQAKLDREFQMMKNNDARLEMLEEQHQVKMAKLAQMPVTSNNRNVQNPIQRGSVRSSISNVGGFSVGNMALSIGLFTTLTGLYGTMVKGMKDVEDGAAGLHQVFGTQVDDEGKLNQVTNDFVAIAQKYGTSVNDVMQGAKQWGRQYKDITTAMTLTNSSTLLSIVDNVKLADSNRALEATMNSMGLAARTQTEAFANSMRIVDSWSALAHKASVSATDLVHATENSAGAAKQAGVDFDQLQALATSAVRNTGLTGSNIGIMLKSLFASIRSDKAEAALKSLDINLKAVGANGEKEFRPVFDVLLELSQKLQTTDKNQQKVIETISGGKFQWSKVASMLSDYNTIIDAYAVSLNLAGAAQQYAQEQMHTLGRDITRLKDTFVELAAQTDQNGLGKFLKTIVEGLTSLIIGLEQMPSAAGQTLLVIGGLLVTMKALNGVMITLEPLARLLVVGFARMTAASTAATAATAAETVATEGLVGAFTTLDIVTGGLALAIGAIVAGITLYAVSQGKATEATRDHAQAIQDQVGIAKQQSDLAQQKEKFMETAIRQEQVLKAALEDTSLSADKRNKIMNDMVDLYHAVGKATGDTALQQVTSSNLSNVSLQSQMTAVKQLVDDKKIAYENLVKINNQEAADDLKLTNQKISDINAVIEGLKRETQAKFSQLSFGDKTKYVGENVLGFLHESLAFADHNKNPKDTTGANNPYYNAAQDVLNKSHDAALAEANSEFDKLQVQKAQDEYKLSSGRLDLANIDTNLNNDTPTGVPDPLGNGKKKAFQFPLKDIDNQAAKAKSLVETASAQIDMYNAKQAAMSQTIDDTAARVEMYTNKQNKLHESNVSLEDAVTKLSGKQATLDQLYNSGKITLDEYNQHSDEVTTRIASLTKELDQNSKAWWDEAKAIREVKDQQVKDSVDASEKWMAHQKAMGDLTAQQEYEAWLRVQDRLNKETEMTKTLTDLRKKADEQVYATKKAYLADEQKQMDDLVKEEKDALNNAKTKELQNIQDRRDAYVKAQDDKIAAIDKLMQAEQQANDDADYNKTLSEKQARANLLESAVGPEGKKERKTVLDEIAKLEEDHRRVLEKRNLESQKQTLEEEKKQKEQAFTDEKTAVERHYADLLKPLDQFKNDVEGRAELLKTIQITKDSEKNAEILKGLDAFIAQYRAKMSSITNLSLSQSQIDLNTYNSNIDKWNSGDASTKAAAHAENEALRQKYGIPADAGKLQHFKDGGIVQGIKKHPVPVIAHAGEMFLNEGQQANLFKLLNIAMPTISMPSLDFSGPKTVIHQYYSFDNSMGDVTLTGMNGVAGLYDQRGGIIERQRSLGEKVR